MAVALYVTSTETYSGKSALCIGLMRRLRKDGFKVGYFKPVSFTPRQEEDGARDEDASVVKATFSLEEPLETLCPVLITHRVMESIIRGQAPDFAAKIRDAYAIVAKGKDVVIIEGANNVASGSLIRMSGIEIIQAFDAKAIVVVRYRDDLVLDHLLIAKRVVGASVIGAVINSVPTHRMAFVQKDVAAFCLSRDIRVFGALPQDRLLLSTSVAEIVEALGGEVLCGHGHLDELVENLLVGAMSVDNALKYMRRKANKVIITGGDRPDLQLAALETASKCLILTGNLHPSPIILGRAEELGVPIVLAKQDTLAAVDIVEGTFGRVRFHDEKKIRRFEALLAEHFDFAGLYAALGLEKQEAPEPEQGVNACR
jgi:BioD-like phosphotransacetylase family protein